MEPFAKPKNELANIDSNSNFFPNQQGFDPRFLVFCLKALFFLEKDYFWTSVHFKGDFFSKTGVAFGLREPLSYGRMEMSRSAVRASKPKKR